MLGIFLIGGFIFCAGMVLGTLFALSFCAGSNIINTLHDQADALRREVQILKQENLELRQELEGEWWEEEESSEKFSEEWWKNGDSNPLGECSH